MASISKSRLTPDCCRPESPLYLRTTQINKVFNATLRHDVNTRLSVNVVNVVNVGLLVFDVVKYF